jgi:glycine betaine/proline transport system substrate-binding protein
MFKRHTSGLMLVLLVGLLGLLTACGGQESAATPAAEVNDKPAITLVANPWPSSELNVAVAELLIERELGNEVEVIALDENLQWDALAKGDADASLEVWPSGHGERIAQYIDEQGVVVNGGPLGPVGIIGWYVPTYVLETHPELATWEGFTNPDFAALFATADTEPKGRFLAGDPSWVQYDADIIRNLGLNLEVVTAGSEEALLAEVSSAIAREVPVLFYFYEPHAAFNRFDLTQVVLPEYTDECYATAAEGGVACAYPTDALFKIFSSKLQEKDTAVYTFLSNMNYDNAAQIQMLAAVEEGKSSTEAAQAWIDANEAIWRTWLP